MENLWISFLCRQELEEEREEMGPDFQVFEAVDPGDTDGIDPNEVREAIHKDCSCTGCVYLRAAFGHGRN